jgi:hypothetical protein
LLLPEALNYQTSVLVNYLFLSVLIVAFRDLSYKRVC